MNRKTYLDTTKGIGILLVVAGHILNIKCLHSWIYSFHIPLFFIVSGITLGISNSWKEKNIKQNIISKAKSLLWPYLTFSIISLIMTFILYGVRPTIRLAANTIIFDGILVLWFLPALFLSNILFIIIEKTIQRLYIKCLLIIIMIAITVCFSLINYQQYDQRLLKWSLTFACVLVRGLNGCIFVYIGYIFSRIIATKPKLISSLNLLICFIISITIHSLLFLKNSVDFHFTKIGKPILYYTNAILGSLIIICLSILIDKILKLHILPWYGRNTIIIFGLHLYIKKVLDLFFVDNSYGKVVLFVIVLALNTCFIFIINKFLPFITKFPRFKNISYNS